MMQVLSVASEAFPLVKTGGLGDVVGALPGALSGHGVMVTTLIPGYPAVRSHIGNAPLVHHYPNLMGAEARILASSLNGFPLLVLDAPALFQRDGGPYGDRSGADWPDNWRRFAALGRAGADLASGAVPNWRFDLLHAHDWHAGLAPAYLRFAPGPGPVAPSLVTIHNMSFQGRFDVSIFPFLGLPPRAYAIDGVEYYGGVGFLKAGLASAQTITAVSPGYASEIHEPAFGMGMEGLIRSRGADVIGILNGIDPKIWDPQSDSALAARYDSHNLAMRRANKRAIESGFGLTPGDGPLFTVISRLSWQKGMDVLAEQLDTLVALGGRLALLGTGEQALEAQFRAASSRHSGRIAVALGYDEKLSHLLQGGADAILIPSRFEPCGLTQLYGLAYGCVPVAARTGGLGDTIIDANEAAQAQGVATGILFDGVTSESLANALQRTVSLYGRRDAWSKMQVQGMSLKLGANPAAGGTQFAVCARDAEKVELCLFDGENESRIPMVRQGENHLALAKVRPGQRYGYRAHGIWAPEQGLMFDAAKLLVDPYAVQLDRRFQYDLRLGIPGVDTALLVPKAIVPRPIDSIAPPPPVFKPGGLIYELNVRGFTRCHPQIPSQLRGTIRALAHPAIIAHFKKLRVAAAELMPIVAWIDERHLPPLGLRNAWGYNPVAPMAIDPGLAPGGTGELEDTIVDLRQAGIGVILDMVLNHTGESDLAGPTLSLRGLDNRCYARRADGTLINDAGTGNILDSSDPVVRDLMLESLRHFARLGVDGFRFDLAPILARAPGFDPQAPIFSAIANDPLLRDRIMIAEPWDVGPGGYQLGHFPDGWLEWNDRYRDDVRRFWRGDSGTLGSLATRMTGSSDIFSGSRSRSVNFLASHDGMTLADTVSYATKHNQANGENNRDGQDENYSWNNGVEGPSRDPDVLRQRQVQMRALLATLFASRGTIQLTAGDEFARSQCGNNNAYAQDNGVTWIDWSQRDTELEDFVAACAAARAAAPALSDTAFLSSADWYDLAGDAMTPEKWENPSADGFEVQIPLADGESLSIRIDRQARQCIVRRLTGG